MKSKLKSLIVLAFIFGITLRVNAQGYIILDGVVVNFGDLFSPNEIDVLHNPSDPTSGGSYTGFILNPVGKTQPTIYTNTFSYGVVLDIGVRVFLVSSNDPISLQPILSQTWTELGGAPSYVFTNGVPFYVGLYTGNVQFAPQNGIYDNPIFGWAELVNNQGTIQVIDSALEYQGGGIYAGTQNIIPVPEPSVFGLSALGCLILAWRRWIKACKAKPMTTKV